MGKYADALFAPAEAGPSEAPISDSSKAAGYGTLAAGSYMPDDGTRARYYAKQRGLPIDRYRISKGRVAYQADNGKWYLEEPETRPLSDPGSLATGAAQMPGPVVGAGPGVVAGALTAPALLSGPLGAAAAVGATTAAGAGGQYLREAVGNAISGETQQGTGMRSAGNAAATAVGEGVGAGINGYLQRWLARDISTLDRAQTAQLQRQAQKEGIPLTPAEATGLQSLGATQRMLTQHPASANAMQRFFSDRSKNIADRANDLIDGISTMDSGELAGTNLRDMARIALETAKNERGAAAAPYYSAAKNSQAFVNVGPALNYLHDAAQSAKGATAAALEKASKLFTDPATGGIDTSVRGLHNTKLALDDLINGFDSDVGAISKGGAKSSAYATLVGLKDKLVQALTSASPDYAQGMKTFEQYSEPLDRLKNSLVGVLARTEDRGAQQALLNAFNPGMTGPRAVAEARQAFMRLGPNGVSAWQDAKRAFLQNALDKASKEYASTSQNPVSMAGPKFAKALFGDPRQARIMEMAFDSSELDALRGFGDVMDAIGRVRNVGSDTAWNQEAIKDAKDQARPLVARIMRNMNPAQFLKSFDEAATQWSGDRKMDALARVYTSPDAMQRLRELRTVAPGTQRFATGVAQLLASLGESAVDSVLARSGGVEPPSDSSARPQSAPAAATPKRKYGDLLTQP